MSETETMTEEASKVAQLLDAVLRSHSASVESISVSTAVGGAVVTRTVKLRPASERA